MFLKYFKKYIGKYRWYFWSGFFALAITDCLDVVPPLIIMRGVDQITSKASGTELLKTALIFAVATIALALIRFHWRMQFGKFHQNIARQMREELFTKLTKLSPSFYSQNSTGELMSLLTNDVEAVRMGLGPGVIVLVDSIFYFLTIPPIMISLSPSLTWKTLILLPVLPIFVNWLGKIINKLFEVEQEKFSELSGIVQENIAGIRTVKSYVQEKNQSDIFSRKSLELRHATEKVALAETFMHPVMEFCVTLGVVTLIFFGTDDVVRGTITIGTFVAFQRYISKMIWPMTAVGWGFSLVSQASASLKRIDEFLQTAPEIDVPSNPASFKNSTISFKNLSFKYPDSQHWALKDIDFKIEPGETIGIIGGVGSGKSTLVQLLCHLYKTDDNNIFIGDSDINDISSQNLRENITLIPQEPFLFSTTIKENISYGVVGAEASMELIEKSACTARIEQEIKKLPHGYDTYLGEDGVNLSGGQKQRLAIARGLARQTPIVIFDDSLSAVDSETEKMILNNLFEATSKQTAVIISHKISSLHRCHRIVALENGRLECIGTPQEMRAQSKVYKELLEHQNDPVSV